MQSLTCKLCPFRTHASRLRYSEVLSESPPPLEASRCRVRVCYFMVFVQHVILFRGFSHMYVINFVLVFICILCFCGKLLGCFEVLPSGVWVRYIVLDSFIDVVLFS